MAKYADGRQGMLKCCLVRNSVYAVRQPADDQRSANSKFPYQSFDHPLPVFGRRAGPYDGHYPATIQVGVTLVIQKKRRFFEPQQPLRVVLIGKENALDAVFFNKSHFLFHDGEFTEMGNGICAYCSDALDPLKRRWARSKDRRRIS